MHAAYATAQRERDEAMAASSASFAGMGSGTRGLFSPLDESIPTTLYYHSNSHSPGIGIGNGSTSGSKNGLGLGRPPLLPTRSNVDMILPASVRHKREVSLNALKARMQPTQTKPLRSPHLSKTISAGGLGNLNEDDEVRNGNQSEHEGEGGNVDEDEDRRGIEETWAGRRTSWMMSRKQFGDEIVFCCPACEGDLITL